MQDNFVQSQQPSTAAPGRKSSNLDKDNLFPDSKTLNNSGRAGFKPASSPLMEAFSNLGSSSPSKGSNSTAQKKAAIQPAQQMVDKGVKEEEKVQMKAGSPQSSGGSSMDQSQSGSLPSSVLGKMEGAFNTKFNDVKVHSNSTSATNMGALAYAQGSDIHFAPGQYNPNSTKGQELIGHELAHVVQQRQGRVKANTQAKGTPVNDDPRLEKEADEMGAKAAQGKFAHVTGNSDQAIQKQEAKENQSTLTTEEEPICIDHSLFASPEVKRRYVDSTHSRITQAYTNFSVALTECKIEIEKAAEAVPSVASLMVEVAMGYLIPGAGRLLSRMVNNIPARSSDFVYNAALTLQNEKVTGPILGVAGGEAKKALQSLLVSEAKQNANAQNSFADQFRYEQGIAFQTLRESINMDSPDLNVLSLYHAFDARVASHNAYKTAIMALLTRFKNDVLGLRERFSHGTMGGSTTMHARLAYIDRGGQRRLAMVTEINQYNLWTAITGDATSYSFDHWISPDMQNLAINEAGGARKVLNLNSDDVSNVR